MKILRIANKGANCTGFYKKKSVVDNETYFVTKVKYSIQILVFRN